MPAVPPVETRLFELEDAATIADLIERAKQLSPSEVQALLEAMEEPREARAAARVLHRARPNRSPPSARKGELYYGDA